MIKKFQENEIVKKKLTDIFWQTASFDNADEKEQKKNRYKYFERYFEKKLPIFYYKNTTEVLGYILGSLETSETFYLEAFPYYAQFELLKDYPAHLHINCHPLAQGQGVGSKLLSHFEHFCLKNGIKGIHLVTALNAKNVSFYLKNNYQKLTTIQWRGVSLLFLGKKLNASQNEP